MILPLSVSGNPVTTGANSYVENILQPGGWEHRIASRGGFISASFELSGSESYLYRWFEEGLGRMVTRYDGMGGIMWQGYVYAMTLTLPGVRHAVTLEHLANRVRAVYAPTDFSGPVPISGEITVTTDSDNADSQALYGISEFVVNAGNVLLNTANAANTQHLNMYGLPLATPQHAPGNARSLTVGCRGYSDWYRRRYYISTSTGNANASAIVTALNTAVGQYIASTDIATNTTQVGQEYRRTDQETSWDILNQITDQGDGTNPWHWGVYEGRQLIYAAMPTDVEYVIHVYGNPNAVRTVSGVALMPWQIRPTILVRIPDLFPLQIERRTTLMLDPQIKRIEAVTWREAEPFTLSLEYSRREAVSSLLAGAIRTGPVL